jgi:hypothetical protein
MERRVFFFDDSGPQNTKNVLHAIRDRLKQGDINKVLVASESARLALEVKDAFPSKTIVCVTYNKYTRRKYNKPQLMKKNLDEREVIVVDSIREPITRELLFRNWWVKKTLKMKGEEADLFWMTLICVGGHGFRTALESVFMAVEAGVVEVGEKVVSIAGTGWGADSAIVMKGSKFKEAVGERPDKRLKIEEILAMPKKTEWVGYG